MAQSHRNGLIFVVFFLHGGHPVPDVNEPVYLGKAKHYWNPDWCPHDLYYNSPDAHNVFFWTTGWLTLFMSLIAYAWTGRILTWLVMAIAWRRLGFAVIGKPWYAIPAAALFVFLQENCSMAGEWVIGGFEPKVIAYTLVFFALERLARNDWNKALLLLGAATSFHVLVGGWSLVAVAFAWVWAPNRPRIRGLLRPGLIAILLAAPGLWLALRLNWGVESAIIEQANQIYVFQRLPHHLVPERFPEARVFAQMALLVVCLLFGLVCTRSAAHKIIGFVLAASVIAVAGVALSAAAGNDPVQYAKWMRYYWFRLADVALPLGTALLVTTLLANSAWTTISRTILAGLLILLGIENGVESRRVLGAPNRSELRMTPQRQRDWKTVCEWIGDTTSGDSLFVYPEQTGIQWPSSGGVPGASG